MATPQQAEWLGDMPLLADAIRVTIIFAGFTLAMLAIKVGVRAGRYGDWERLAGTISFACFAVTPSVTSLTRFDEPLRAVTTCIYLLGLLGGAVAMAYRITLLPSWRRRQRTWREVRGRRPRIPRR